MGRRTFPPLPANPGGLLEDYTEVSKQVFAGLIAASAASQDLKNGRAWVFKTDELATKTNATYSAGEYSGLSITDICTGGTASASSQQVGYEADKAFDNNNSTSWSATTVPAQLKYDFGLQTQVSGYAVQEGTFSYDPGTAWTFEGSNDNSAWTTLDTRSGLTWSAQEKKTFTLSAIASYRYYRLNVSAATGGVVQAGEMEIYGTPLNVTLVPSSTTAASAPIDATVAVLARGTLTPATGISVELSRDGGSNYSSAVYGQAPLYYDGTHSLYMFKFPLSIMSTSGTSPVWRLKTYNNVLAHIRAAAMFWA